MKSTIFRDIMPCSPLSVTDVSALYPRGLYSSKRFINICWFLIQKIFSISNIENRHFIYNSIAFDLEPRFLGLPFESVFSICRCLSGCYLMIWEDIYFTFFITVTPRTETVLSGFCTPSDELRAGHLGFESGLGQEIFPYSTASTQWVLQAPFPGVKRLGREADHSPPSNAEVKNGGAIPPLSHTSSQHSA
jgi:hypothetical protein